MIITTKGSTERIVM